MLREIHGKLQDFRTELEVDVAVDQCEVPGSSPVRSGGEIVLNNGERMPVIGLGTAGFTDKQVVHQTIFAALKAGYRMIGNDSISKTKTKLLFINRHSRSVQ